MPSSANENDRNLLDSAARIFRGRMTTPGSRFHELLDTGMGGQDSAQTYDPDLTQTESTKISLPATERLSRSVAFSLPQIGDMPPEPPTLRGRVGAVLVAVVRRALFWYTAQIKTFHAAVAEAAREWVPALQNLDAQQRRQRALIAEVRHRLIELERQAELNQAAIASSVAAQASLRDELHLYKESSQDGLRQLEQKVGSLDQAQALFVQGNRLQEEENVRRREALAAHICRLDDALAAIREVHSSFRQEAERHRDAAAARWKQMEAAIDQYQLSQASYRERQSLQRSELFARLAQIDATLAAIRQTKAAFEEEIRRDFKAEVNETAAGS